MTQDYVSCLSTHFSSTKLKHQSVTAHMVKVKVKAKQSFYRDGQAHKVPGSLGFQISRQSAHKCGKIVSPTHRTTLPQELFLILIYVVVQLVDALCCKSEGREIDSQWCFWNFY
jgi:hypothetical protein